MSPLMALAIAAALVTASAFFVAAEFAIVSARRHRLEEAAAAGRGAARAALGLSRDVSMTLAGCQLGITLCTLGLGAVAKPAVKDVLKKAFDGAGVPTGLAEVLAFVVALVAVTLVHLVVGEMAPKSWAIGAPERSAVLLAPLMQAFMWLTRPVLRSLNALANVSLHRLGVELVDELTQARDPQTLRELVSHSGEAGTLDEERRHRLLGTLDLDDLTVGSLLAERDRPPAPADGVAADDAPHAIRQAARRSGHLRLLVYRDGNPVGVVHVRDVLTAKPGTTAERVMRPLLVIGADEPAHRALDTLREKQTQIALVTSDGDPAGVITMQDLMNRLLREPPTPIPHRVQ